MLRVKKRNLSIYKSSINVYNVKLQDAKNKKESIN